MVRHKKQTRISLVPLDESAAIPNDRIAVNDGSQLASVRFGTTSQRQIIRQQNRHPESSSFEGASQQGTLDMAFARAASLGEAKGKQKAEMIESDSESSSSDDTTLPPMPSWRNNTPISKSNATAFFQASSTQPSGPIATPRSKQSPTQLRSVNGLFPSSSAAPDDSSGVDDAEVIYLAPSGSKRVRQSSPAPGNSRDGDTATPDEVDLGSSSAGDMRRSTRRQSGPTKDVDRNGGPKSRKRLCRGPRRGTREDDPVDVSESDSKCAAKPEPPGRRRLVRGRRRAVPSDEDSDVVEHVEPRRVSISRPNSIASASDEDSEVIVSSARKRRRPSSIDGSSAEASARKSRQEKEDLDEDLDFLRSSSPPGGRSSVRKMSARDERRLLLERMKARRANKNVDSESEQEGEDAPEGDQDGGSEVIDDCSNALHDGDDMENFVLEDDPDEESIDHRAEIPIELTAFAHKSLKAYFGHVVEWMVQNKLNPAFPRNDPLYQLAFRKVKDEVQGYASSKFMSTTWRPDFLRALQARPEFNEEPITRDEFFGDHCAACGRTSHPATFIVTFTGKAYHPETLEPLKEDEEYSSSSEGDESGSASSDEDKQSVDYQGHELPPEDYEFNVGRICKQNAYHAHALTHWRWHLNSWVLDWLKHDGYLEPEQVVERENWSTKKKNKYANRVMDDLEQKELKNLWRDFKIQLETAQEAKTYERYR